VSVPPYGGDQYQPYQQPPPPPYGAPYGGPPLYQARTTNGLAIASMVVGILSGLGALSLCGVGGIFGIVAAIMGHVARGQIKRGNQDGAGMALAGIIVGWIAFAAAVIAILVVIAFIIAVGHTPNPYSGTSV
jgi:hypothetical protein